MNDKRRKTAVNRRRSAQKLTAGSRLYKPSIVARELESGIPGSMQTRSRHFQMRHLGANFGNDARSLMAQDHRLFDDVGADAPVQEVMQIAGHRRPRCGSGS